MEYNPFSLSGKTILVTGASSGIGRETAIACSRMGARLVITARNQERLQATLDQLNPEVDGHMQLIADMTVQQDIERIVGEMPKLDGAVLCAGNDRATAIWYPREAGQHVQHQLLCPG